MTAEELRALDPEAIGDHVDRLYRAALGLCGNRHDAEDLVQETYARVLAKPRFVRRDGDIAYLLRALRNTFTSERRYRSRRPVQPLPEEQEPPDTRSGGRPADAAEATEVFRIVSELPGDARDVIVAVDLVGLSYREAATLLGIEEGTVMSRLYRARRRVARSVGSE
jgi:RNA polymerase sigma-70 factor (ECF subfamily)